MTGIHTLVRDVDVLPKGHLRIETGLLYPDGASIEVYLVEDASLPGGHKLTDLGQTTSWLLDVQVKPWLSKKRQRLLEDAIDLYGVRQNGGALELPLESIDQIPEGIIRLGQACLRVSDLLFTRRSALQSVFLEDVEEVIVDTDLPFESNKELIGKYEKPVRVDFLVQGQRTQSAILALASGNASQAHGAATEIFSRWYDLKDERNEQRITVFDDSKDVYREHDLRRLEELSILIGLSDRQAFRDVIAA
jgi:hypothetical protein